MDRQRITLKGVDNDAIDMLHEIKERERRFLGAIASDAIRYYWSEHQDNEEDNELIYE